MIEAPTVVSEATVLDALRGVIDPELDESLVDLGFVESVRVDDRPTYDLEESVRVAERGDETAKLFRCEVELMDDALRR